MHIVVGPYTKGHFIHAKPFLDPEFFFFFFFFSYTTTRDALIICYTTTGDALIICEESICSFSFSFSFWHINLLRKKITYCDSRLFSLF
jgi:hypothetical protein